MKVSLTNAKPRLMELVRLAEAGEEIILTRRNQPAVRLIPVKSTVTAKFRRQLVEELQLSASKKATAGRSAARSQDFPCDEHGLPG